MTDLDSQNKEIIVKFWDYVYSNEKTDWFFGFHLNLKLKDVIRKIIKISN